VRGSQWILLSLPLPLTPYTKPSEETLGAKLSKEIIMNKKIDLVGVQNDFSEEAGNLVRTDSQQISQGFLDDLKDKRNNSTKKREGDFQHVASIPVIFVEKWKKEGFDIMDGSVPFKEIIKKLKAENLDGFMATEKSI